MEGTQDYRHYYPGTGFVHRLGRIALRAGRVAVEQALVLHYTAQDPNTPGWARRTAYGALGYLLAPVDAVPDLTPVVGYSDDWTVIAAALGTLAAHVTPLARERAREKTAAWLGATEEEARD